MFLRKFHIKFPHINDINRIREHQFTTALRRNDLKYFKDRKPFLSPKFKVYLALGIVTISAYYIANLERVPLSNRIRFNNISPKQEVEMSRISEHQIINQYKSRILSPTHPYSQLIAKVAKRILKVTGADHQWKIVVIDSNELNAFVLPTGTIFVFTGILPVMKDEDGIAAVLGHEIAHVLGHHAAEKISWMNLLSIARFGLILVGLDPGPALSSIILQFGFLLPNSRVCESEADQIGLDLMAKACFDPRGAVKLWERMSLVEKGQRLEYLSTHPSNKTRIDNLKKWMASAEKTFNENCGDTKAQYEGFFSNVLTDRSW